MIFHLVKKSEWLEAVQRGQYEPASLKTEGFVHGSTLGQILDTANHFFRGQPDLLLLCIEEARLAAAVQWEAPASPQDERHGERFPHIYGAVNLEAVTQVIDFPCELDLSFRLPATLRDR